MNTKRPILLEVGAGWGHMPKLTGKGIPEGPDEKHARKTVQARQGNTECRALLERRPEKLPLLTPTCMSQVENSQPADLPLAVQGDQMPGVPPFPSACRAGDACASGHSTTSRTEMHTRIFSVLRGSRESQGGEPLGSQSDSWKFRKDDSGKQAPCHSSCHEFSSLA